MNTAQLQRLDRKSIEARAMGFSIGLWMLLWMLIGISGRIFFGDWYGFGAGFIIAPVISILLMWILFARPEAKKKRIVRASWTEHSLRIYDPIEDRHESVDFNRPHKAVLITAKNERRFLLRIDQLADTKDKQTRIDIIGTIPMAMPMVTAGDAMSLKGFFKMAGRDGALKATPYRLKQGSDTDQVINNLMMFIEKHKEFRNNTVWVKRGEELIKIDHGKFSLVYPDREIHFSDPSTLSIDAIQDKSGITGKNRNSDKYADVLLAIIPPSGKNDALLFSLIYPLDTELCLKDTWDMPKNVLKRKFTLYDDSVNTFIATRTLKNYLKTIDPNNPVLEILRH